MTYFFIGKTRMRSRRRYVWTPFFLVKLKRNEAFQKVTGFWLKIGLRLAYGWALIVEEHFIGVKTPMNLERSCFGKNFKRVFEGFHGHNTQKVSRVVLVFSPGKKHCFLLKQAFIDACFCSFFLFGYLS